MNMSNSDLIKIKLSATNQSGIVAALHLIANKFGVKVKDNLVSKVSRNRNRVIVIFEGNLNVSQTEFFDAIESHSRIYSIDDIEVKPNLTVYVEDDSDFESIVKEVEEDDERELHLNIYGYDDVELESETLDSTAIASNKQSTRKEFSKISYKFNANDSLTEEAIAATEEVFQNLFGSVASLFVSTAVIESNTVGELFLLLSEELDGEVKANFLALVKGID